MEALTTSQKTNKFNFFMHSVAVLACILFSTIIFCFLPSIKVFVFGSLPRIMSVFLSSKSVFIFGNVIVIVLIGESKFFAPNHPATSDVFYNEYMSQRRSFQPPSSSTSESKKKVEANGYMVERSCADAENNGEKKWCEEKKNMKKGKQNFGGEDESGLSSEELKRRAEELIKRVNRQRRLEAKQNKNNL